MGAVIVLTGAEEVAAWTKTQEEVVILVSAYLAPVRAFVERFAEDADFAVDPNNVYQLHTLVTNWKSAELMTRLQHIGLTAYYHPLTNPRDSLEIAVTAQTIPSSRRPADEFVSTTSRYCDSMSETMLAFAKVPSPAFSITLAAGTPFEAYLLISRLVENATDFVYVVDAYADASLFSRYLFRVKDGVQVSVRTDPSKWNRTGGKAQFEEAEMLFRAQHPPYDRQDRKDLHARYLITETGGWQFDGSIKDVALSKDSTIHTLLPEEREKVIADYFAKAAE